MTMMCKIHNKPLQDGFCEDCLSAVSPVPSEPLLAASSIDELKAENRLLVRMLLFYGDHCKPCNEWYDAEGPCTCKWESLEKHLYAANGKDETHDEV